MDTMSPTDWQYWMFRKLLALKYGIRVIDVDQDVIDKYNREKEK